VEVDGVKATDVDGAQADACGIGHFVCFRLHRRHPALHDPFPPTFHIHPFLSASFPIVPACSAASRGFARASRGAFGALDPACARLRSGRCVRSWAGVQEKTWHF
jgi:hypothetical protein